VGRRWVVGALSGDQQSKWRVVRPRVVPVERAPAEGNLAADALVEVAVPLALRYDGDPAER